MRLKINLDIDKLPVKDVVIKTSSVLNKLLGDNNKWHDMVEKPYTSSLISGGTLQGENIVFNNNAHFYINTEDKEVIRAVLKNKGINFDTPPTKVFSGYNLLSVKKVRYKTKGKNKWVTPENSPDFIKYVKNKYGVDIEIYKYDNSVVYYKRGSKISVSNLLIRTTSSSKDVAKLFQSGIGASTSIGFGFVEPVNKD